MDVPHKRLEGKTAVITGGAGGIGYAIAKRFLEEGASVILTGRTLQKLEKTIEQLQVELPNTDVSSCAQAFVLDGSLPEALKIGAEQIHSKYKSIDILINNSGSVGPRQQLGNIPLSEKDLKELMSLYGIEEKETLLHAIQSLLGSAWYTTLAFLPYLSKGASVVNISTIFSKSEYFGRIAYVVPKAGMNSLTQILAYELGYDWRGIRVNTVLPGPVESERISSAFAAMDHLRKAPEGTTRDEVVSNMILHYPSTGSFYLSKKEIADTIVFLASDESTGFSGHDFQVTHGLQVPSWSSEVITRPDLKHVNFKGELIWIMAGDQLQEVHSLCAKYQALGAQLFVTFRNTQTLEANRDQFAHYAGLKLFPEDFQNLAVADPFQENHWIHIQDEFKRIQRFPKLILILSNGIFQKYGNSVLKIEKAEAFLNQEFYGALAISRHLDRMLQGLDSFLTFDPSIIFVSDSAIDKKCAFSRILSAGIQQLIRGWRNEIELMTKSGYRHHLIHIHQIIRFENQCLFNFDLAAEWALYLAFVSNHSLTPLKEIDLILSPSLQMLDHNDSNPNHPSFEFDHLCSGRVAMVTGGSSGLGAEISRQLALAGAHVMIAARSHDKASKTRQKIVQELQDLGFSDPESRVATYCDCDIGNLKDLKKLTDYTLSKFGKIDYLINNVGVPGAEQMIVDLPLQSWNDTLVTNLVSNYDLMIRFLPLFKQKGFGHILNISSHFGGMRDIYIPYPNRADYAVSKTGQRALAETFALLIGPDIQINAIAPGPIEGERVRGADGALGLFARRAQLILQNKRLNLIYTELIQMYHKKLPLIPVLEQLVVNDLKKMTESSEIPDSLKEQLLKLYKQKIKKLGDVTEPISILTKKIFHQLLNRLCEGQFLTASEKTFALKDLQAAFIERNDPLFFDEERNLYAQQIEENVLKICSLGKFPKNTDVARDIILSLANHTISGEAVFLSCGLDIGGMKKDISFMGKTKLSSGIELYDERILIIGDSMFEQIAALAKHYLQFAQNQPNGKKVKIITILCGSESSKSQLLAALNSSGRLPLDPRIQVITRCPDETISDSMDAVITQYGCPRLIISFPAGEIATAPSSIKGELWEILPDTEAFQTLIAQQITHHFTVIKRSSLIDNSRTIIIAPAFAEKTDPLNTALVKFVRTTLHPLIITATIEGARIVHQPAFHQVDPDESLVELHELILRESLFFNGK